MASLITHAQLMVWVGACCTSCHCAPCLSENNISFRTPPQHDVVRRSKDHFWSFTAKEGKVSNDLEPIFPSGRRGGSTAHIALISIDGPSWKQCTVPPNDDDATFLQVADDGISNWSVNEFIEFPARCAGFSH